MYALIARIVAKRLRGRNQRSVCLLKVSPIGGSAPAREPEYQSAKGHARKNMGRYQRVRYMLKFSDP